ncbi:MAG: hypothetical protein M5R36_11325 [Deltaproteobacteria bacterium]|nr:hypothetical protein [Deltaproteobacteria bacterium]
MHSRRAVKFTVLTTCCLLAAAIVAAWAGEQTPAELLNGSVTPKAPFTMTARAEVIRFRDDGEVERLVVEWKRKVDGTRDALRVTVVEPAKRKGETLISTVAMSGSGRTAARYRSDTPGGSFKRIRAKDAGDAFLETDFALRDLDASYDGYGPPRLVSALLFNGERCRLVELPGDRKRRASCATGYATRTARVSKPKR